MRDWGRGRTPCTIAAGGAPVTARDLHDAGRRPPFCTSLRQMTPAGDQTLHSCVVSGAAVASGAVPARKEHARGQCMTAHGAHVRRRPPHRPRLAQPGCCLSHVGCGHTVGFTRCCLRHRVCDNIEFRSIGRVQWEPFPGRNNAPQQSCSNAIRRCERPAGESRRRGPGAPARACAGLGVRLRRAGSYSAEGVRGRPEGAVGGAPGSWSRGG